jgi:hypothetical protein
MKGLWFVHAITATQDRKRAGVFGYRHSQHASRGAFRHACARVDFNGSSRPCRAPKVVLGATRAGATCLVTAEETSGHLPLPVGRTCRETEPVRWTRGTP